MIILSSFSLKNIEYSGTYIYIYICVCVCVYIYHHHHHHVVRLAQISLTLSLHVSLSFIASGRSSRLHPVSSHSCCMYVRAGRPAFDWPYAGGPQEYITYDLVLASPAVSGMSGSFSLYSFRDRW